MPTVIISTYEGVLCGYELTPEEEGLTFNQVINSQEGKQPLRAVAVIGDTLFFSSGALVMGFNLSSKRMIGRMEFKERVDRLLSLGRRLLVVCGEMIRICDPKSCTELMAYHGCNTTILDVCAYQKTSFCALTKKKLFAFCLNSPKPLAELPLPAEFQQAFFVSEKEVLLIAGDHLIKFDIESQKQISEFKASGLYGFCADTKQRCILVGTSTGELYVLDLNLERRKKVKIGDGRVKRILPIEEGTFLVVQSDGTVSVFAYDAEQNEALLLGQKEITKRPMDAIVVAIKDEAQEDKQGKEALEEGEEEMFEEFLEDEEEFESESENDPTPAKE